MSTQHYEAAQRRRSWTAKGNPPCEHPQTQKEVLGFQKSGDLVCMTCGLIDHPSKFRRK